MLLFEHNFQLKFIHNIGLPDDREAAQVPGEGGDGGDLLRHPDQAAATAPGPVSPS